MLLIVTLFLLLFNVSSFIEALHSTWFTIWTIFLERNSLCMILPMLWVSSPLLIGCWLVSLLLNDYNMFSVEQYTFILNNVFKQIVFHLKLWTPCKSRTPKCTRWFKNNVSVCENIPVILIQLTIGVTSRQKKYSKEFTLTVKSKWHSKNTIWYPSWEKQWCIKIYKFYNWHLMTTHHNFLFNL